MNPIVQTLSNLDDNSRGGCCQFICDRRNPGQVLNLEFIAIILGFTVSHLQRLKWHPQHRLRSWWADAPHSGGQTTQRWTWPDTWGPSRQIQRLETEMIFFWTWKMAWFLKVRVHCSTQYLHKQVFGLFLPSPPCVRTMNTKDPKGWSIFFTIEWRLLST